MAVVVAKMAPVAAVVTGTSESFYLFKLLVFLPVFILGYFPSPFPSGGGGGYNVTTGYAPSNALAGDGGGGGSYLHSSALAGGFYAGKQ